MKIVMVDNYNRDSVADVLIAENVNENYAQKIVEFLNEKEGENSTNWFSLKPDDYRLSRGMEDLV
jgi:hypothetical protein